MTKWADYLISAVRYNAEHSHIVQVKQHQDSGDSVKASTIVPRSTVVANLKARTTYMTIYKDNDGKWKKGEEVIIKPVEGTEYITTDPNETKKDNLGELPEF